MIQRVETWRNGKLVSAQDVEIPDPPADPLQDLVVSEKPRVRTRLDAIEEKIKNVRGDIPATVDSLKAQVQAMELRLATLESLVKRNNLK